ncbi:MAG: SagB/ThcOx family dehydrogenase [Desulfurococcaceae archaeon]
MELKLPEPNKTTCLCQLLIKRRSIRKFRKEPLKLDELSQLLWTSYGLIDRRRRVVPSAGATYPIELYLVVRDVEGVRPGVYRYIDQTHSLMLIKEGDYSWELTRACLDQLWVKEAPVNIILVALYEKTTSWYGERGFRYIHNEAGHIGQNIYLASSEMSLGTVAIGAFHDNEVLNLIGLGNDYIALYVFPVGRPV